MVLEAESSVDDRSCLIGSEMSRVGHARSLGTGLVKRIDKIIAEGADRCRTSTPGAARCRAITGVGALTEASIHIEPSYQRKQGVHFEVLQVGIVVLREVGERHDCW